MKDLVDEGLSVLTSGESLTGFGELLHEAWQAKRRLSERVSNSEVDKLYDTARSAGATGGKLIGAGGGGFLLLFVPPASQSSVKSALCNILHVPFNFEFGGSQIIFFDPEKDYLAEEQDRANRQVAPFRELMSAN
jgi:D-glycero-alpha-D-manno-heptose-7-phosphate kinase